MWWRGSPRDRETACATSAGCVPRRPRTAAPAVRSCPFSGRGCRQRQADDEARADAGSGCDADDAAVLLDDLVRDREAEPGALADRLGREERIEDAFEVGFGDALAVVLDDDDRAPAENLRADRDAPAIVLDRLRGVADQVQQHLVDLRRRAFDRRNRAAV